MKDLFVLTADSDAQALIGAVLGCIGTSKSTRFPLRYRGSLVAIPEW